MSKIPNGRYTKEFREEALKMVVTGGHSAGSAALLIEIHEEWINSPRYLNIETIHSLTPEEEFYRKKVA